VGGIQRDIFTMGARPIASLNSLRFGNINDKKTQRLLAGVVHGIGHYGNCFGVPTVAGETYFEDCYATNPLVNAMSVGIVKIDKTISATAKGVGNPVFFVGSATGKDGIGGASFASANITEDSAEDLPAVQVGDPFQEKKLLEACLEVIETGAVVGMQDMGAAGIICSTSEMSAKGNVGMRIDLDKVPTRQQNMQAWELLLSESQERMLLVAEKGKENDVIKVFEKWDLPCTNIGEVTDDGLLKFYLHGNLEAELPAHDLVLGGGAPQYSREYKEPSYLKNVEAFNIYDVKDIDEKDVQQIAKQIISLPNIASKRWISVQYDSTVGAANTSTNAPGDAAIVLAKGTGKALAVTVDCNGRYAFADPYKGAMIAVAEAARNIVCSGAEPIGVTNCLNFGNPYNPEVYYQFVKAVEGMGEVCKKFNTPVTGGNVSFYNQNPDGAVYPTPTIGMVGVLDDFNNRMTLDFKHAGDAIVLIGTQKNDVASSEYLHKIKRVEFSPAPAFDIDEEFAVQKFIASIIKEKIIVSAHDLSEGGLIVALFESAFHNNLGFEIDTEVNTRNDAFWFGEAQSRILISCSNEKLQSLKREAASAGIDICVMGKVTGGEIKINKESWDNIKEWETLYNTSIEKILAG
jgi:phosphoribosylformylglycinamidine synthase